MFRGDTSYIIDDLIEYGGMEQEDAENIVDSWSNSDLIIILNEVYSTHDIEYIVPDKYYTGNSAKIEILEKLTK